MVTGFVGISTPTMHKSVITAATVFQCNYDANIITLNREAMAMTQETRSVKKSGEAPGLQDGGVAGNA